MKILLYIVKSKVRKNGTMPINIRITEHGKRIKDISTGVLVDVKEWNQTEQRILNDKKNQALQEIVEKIVKNKGTKAPKMTPFLSALVQGCSLKGVRKLYKSFIEVNNDTLINNLNADIWTRLYELGIKRGLKASSIKVYLSKIKQLIKEYDSTIQVPEMLKIKNVLKPLVYMNMKDVEKIDLENKYLRLFYIQAKTGLAFVDVQNVVIDNDIKPYLDNYILTVKREKTNQVSIIPITKKVKELLTVVLNEKKIKYYAYYSNIGKILGKHITTHVARKTYAMHLLNKGMSIESVSRVLGHSTIATTQKYYVRVTEERIMNEFVKLAS